MADAIGSLYAEINFRVNESGLTEAKNKLIELQQEVQKYADAINKLFNDEQNGINENIKLKQKEVSETADANKKMIESHKKKNEEIIKSDTDLLDTKKKLGKQTTENEKLVISDLSKLWRQGKKTANDMWRFARASWGAVQTGINFISPSRERAIGFRDFSFESGMDLSEFQRIERLFAGSGIKMSSQDLFGDILGIQRNLTDIALGRGNLNFYKLMGVKEAAQRRDIAGVISGIIGGVQRNEIDKSMLVKLLGEAGINNPVQWAMMIDRNPQMAERMATLSQASLSNAQMGGIQEAQSSLIGLSYSFEVLRDQITSAVSPALNTFAKYFSESYAEMAKYLKDNSESIQKSLDKYAKSFVDFLKQVDWRALASNIQSLIPLLSAFGSAVYGLVVILKPIAFVVDALTSLVKTAGEALGSYWTNAALRMAGGEGTISSLIHAFGDTNQGWDNSTLDDFFNRNFGGGGSNMFVSNNTINNNMNVSEKDVAERTGKETERQLSAAGYRIDKINYNTTWAGSNMGW